MAVILLRMLNSIIFSIENVLIAYGPDETASIDEDNCLLLGCISYYHWTMEVDYSWYLNGSLLKKGRKANLVYVQQPGQYECVLTVNDHVAKSEIITPPTRRVWRSFKFAPFLFFFPVSKVGLPLMGDTAVQYTDCYLDSEPMSTRLLNSISSRICRQNTQFNMYTTTSKQQEDCTFKDSRPECFITTNFDKYTFPESTSRLTRFST